ncbi:hypothetical protein NPIL_476091 [Nephila pilipes]|uniref:Uncharacterized protein n=1 Tax=Nephila pilipes TaxID=299642 RepID=A0A8X6TDS6_NEPPI|nr:hypothetical protein NPIL_476091 [Nephila pilipes]
MATVKKKQKKPPELVITTGGLTASLPKRKKKNKVINIQISVTPPFRANRRISRRLRRGQGCLVVQINDLLPVPNSSSVVGYVWTNEKYTRVGRPTIKIPVFFFSFSLNKLYKVLSTVELVSERDEGCF